MNNSWSPSIEKSGGLWCAQVNKWKVFALVSTRLRALVRRSWALESMCFEACNSQTPSCASRQTVWRAFPSGMWFTVQEPRGMLCFNFCRLSLKWSQGTVLLYALMDIKYFMHLKNFCRTIQYSSSQSLSASRCLRFFSYVIQHKILTFNKCSCLSVHNCLHNISWKIKDYFNSWQEFHNVNLC